MTAAANFYTKIAPGILSYDVHFTNLLLVQNVAASELFFHYRPKHRFMDWKTLQEVCEITVLLSVNL